MVFITSIAMMVLKITQFTYGSIQIENNPSSPSLPSKLFLFIEFNHYLWEEAFRNSNTKEIIQRKKYQPKDHN